MAKEATLQVRMDADLKEKAEALYRDMGTSFAEAVRLYRCLQKPLYRIYRALLCRKMGEKRFFWTGWITTKARVVHGFGNEDIVKGSGYITSQCCGSAENEIGTAYAAEMGITLFSEIDRYTLEDAKIEFSFILA